MNRHMLPNSWSRRRAHHVSQSSPAALLVGVLPCFLPLSLSMFRLCHGLQRCVHSKTPGWRRVTPECACSVGGARGLCIGPTSFAEQLERLCCDSPSAIPLSHAKETEISPMLCNKPGPGLGAPEYTSSPWLRPDCTSGGDGH